MTYKYLLLRRGCNAPEQCIMCETDTRETDVHLFWRCPFTSTFWATLIDRLGGKLPEQPLNSHIAAWKYPRIIGGTEGSRTWQTAWAAGLWSIWRERNNRIFSSKSKTSRMLVTETEMDIQRWLKHC
ncbi:hypothetical protein FCM35_KLT11163 [Carex littledalei]|uniref:Reverse transcriptase zinc-binding domain-containing protein n=1 Tax=Carex littledalei TaxID=544730 RepID=A0A833QNA4_9POAL|nr:hypothetical protein FCM35_KLT11163 [Carex littledalei]